MSVQQIKRNGWAEFQDDKRLREKMFFWFSSTKVICADVLSMIKQKSLCFSAEKAKHKTGITTILIIERLKKKIKVGKMQLSWKPGPVSMWVLAETAEQSSSVTQPYALLWEVCWPRCVLQNAPMSHCLQLGVRQHRLFMVAVRKWRPQTKTIFSLLLQTCEMK